MSLTSTLPDLEVAKQLGLNEEEFEKIQKILGRDPNFTELSIFSVMWSEHCSYKNSIKYLKTLPRDGEKLLVGAGEENAGLVDIGDGMACAFKIESHNHPSAIEPYQGAATGVGGIHRDIFTMGARPIAALNSLRFGEIDREETKHLIDGVVRGIGDYGNCLGVPTVGGEVYFDSCYNQNILVNPMSVGIVRANETISAIAEGPGNPVFIVGSATGKDGIHGATFASADLTEDSAEDLPAVQVGDPFQEKLLLEASLEAIKTGALIGMQDMGAAGITCSTSEMSAKGEVGMIIHLDRVPTRQENMQSFEILLSESQERMLIVCKQGMEEVMEAVFDKWNLECCEIGTVTDTGRLEFYNHGELVADVPAHDLVLGGGAPVYDRPYSEPSYYSRQMDYSSSNVEYDGDLLSMTRKIISSPNLISRKWIFEQYDSMVRTNTIHTNSPSDAAIIRLKGSKKALLATTDCNSSYVHADPYVGTMIAVSEAARNIVCSGGTPVAITNCLNFGNPYSEDVYWQFVNAIKGMGEACRKFNTPVTGGNVSFYNQSIIGDQTVPVYPTPTIGMLGILEDIDNRMTLDFKKEGDLILLLGETHDNINRSEYLQTIMGIRDSKVPVFNMNSEVILHDAIGQLIRAQIVNSVHDVSEGGIIQSLLESSFPNDIGFKVKNNGNLRDDVFFFNESQSRAIISLNPENKDDVIALLNNIGIPHEVLGVTIRGKIMVNEQEFGDVQEWQENHSTLLSQQMDK